MVVASVGYALGCGVALLAWVQVEAQRKAGAIEAFGNATAQDIAEWAVAPLMRQDRVALGLIASRVAERPQVRGINVQTVDGRPFVVVGEAVRPEAPSFAAPIAVQDSMVGSVRVSLNQDAFGLSLLRLLRLSWWLWPLGLLLAAGGGYLADRQSGRRTATPGPPAPEDPAPTPPVPADAAAAEADGPFVLAANLFNRAGLAVAAEDDAMRRCSAMAEAVAQRCGGSTALVDTGVVVTFATSEADAALQGALLLQATMTLQEELAKFRYALERVPRNANAPADAVAAMASLAADGGLILGAAAVAGLEQPERVRLTAIDNPAAKLLPPGARPSHLVQGVAAAEEAALADQATALIASFEATGDSEANRQRADP